MDRFGRRPLLLWGSLSMTVAHLIIAVLVGKFSGNWPAHRDAGWTSVAFVSPKSYVRIKQGLLNATIATFLHAQLWCFVG